MSDLILNRCFLSWIDAATFMSEWVQKELAGKGGPPAPPPAAKK